MNLKTVIGGLGGFEPPSEKPRLLQLANRNNDLL